MFKNIIRKIYYDIKRLVDCQRVSFLFSRNRSIIRKPLHVTNIKYISVGNNVSIDSFSRLDCYETKTNIPELILCNNVKICFNFTALCSTKLYIGDNVLIASNVFITTENHGINPELGLYINQELLSKEVIINKNAWIGENVSILSGVHIGEFSIIGAGSVVTKNIAPYSIAVGNPASVIKKYDFESHRWKKVGDIN